MFKIGEKVVCKDTSDSKTGRTTPTGIKKGIIYTITNISNCPCCSKELISLAEVPVYDKYCDCRAFIPNSKAYYSARFEKLDYQIIPNKELISKEILEVSDCLTESVMQKQNQN